MRSTRFNILKSYKGDKKELRWMLDELRARNLGRQERDRMLRRWMKMQLGEKPLSYILGWIPFLHHRISVRPPVLIPRWETEEIVDRVIQMSSSQKPTRILDLCSGSGCISIALASAFPEAEVDGLDISTSAIKLAKLNKRRNKVKNNLAFHLVDIFSPELERFRNYDLVISNPPYISESDYRNLPKSVFAWEDQRALVALNKGLQFYEHIAAQQYLFSERSTLVFEIGETQGPLVKEILAKNGFTAQIMRDSANADRCVVGQVTL